MWVSVWRGGDTWKSGTSKNAFVQCHLDMCPKPNATRNGLSSKSHVEDLEGIPGLFKALTDVEEDNWSTMTYPVDFDAALYGAKFDWEMAVVSRKCKPIINLCLDLFI